MGQNNGGSKQHPSSTDLLRLLSDLTKSSDYTASDERRIQLTQRVKALLESLRENTELRNTVYSGTYGAGTCGDGAIITFNKLELLVLTSYSVPLLQGAWPRVDCWRWQKVCVT